MSKDNAGTPRVFIIRHGETEWSKSGQYTGKTDLPLLPEGEDAVRGSARFAYGDGRLIDPGKLGHVFISPRKRAGRTWEIFVEEGGMNDNVKVETTEDIAEWNYGEYEGKLTKEIRAMRKGRGLDKEKPWDIWRDGCEGGERPQEVERRLDNLIGRIKAVHKSLLEKGGSGDVMVVAHGHILRAFVKRWLSYPLEFPLSMMLEPGGVGGLSYQHGSIDEPAILVGMSYRSKKERWHEM